ncbi:MAG: hypothetical protein IT438_02585 [Phycisphaerales bacterium]|nr:hypothetical protein [Phycisphaerales bacterium]
MNTAITRRLGATTRIKDPSRPAVLYPQLYAWYILAATLDVVVTHAILHHFGGEELNRIADALIRRFGVAGMIGLKYSSIILVISICEFVGQRNLRLGRRLAVLAVGLSALPVGVGLLKTWQWTRTPNAAIETLCFENREFDGCALPIERPWMRDAAREQPCPGDPLRPLASW